MAANNICSNCGKQRELQYANDSCCRECRSERNKAVRAGKMVAKGKRPQGSGRSPNCSKCGAVKDRSFVTSGYCRKCKSEVNIANRLKARLARGQVPLGEGRKYHCSDCGGLKENRNQGYCHACNAKHEKSRRIENRKSIDFVIRERHKVNTRSKNDSVYKHKRDVHLLTNAATRLGLLVKKPCEICGMLKVDAHHDDYTKPLEVRWLCRKHHNEHHRKLENLT